MSLAKIATAEFGSMTLDTLTGCYETEVVIADTKALRISIAAEELEAGLKRMSAFIDWLQSNHQAFKLPLELAIQNFDLVWDDVWDSILGEDWVDRDDGFLAEYLTYKSVDFNHSKIHLWVDTSGLHTDHMVRVTMKEDLQIERCEML